MKTIYRMKSINSLFIGLIALLFLGSSCSDPMVRNLPDGLFAFVEADSGNFVINLDYIRAPMTVANFVGLAEGTIPNTFREAGEPFFDSLTFHRYAPGFVVQGGDPLANGTGGPGYKFPQEISPDLTHQYAGTVAMANSGPGTNGSQWYVTLGSAPHLDGGYNVFGHVIRGMENVYKIRVGHVIHHISIIRNGSGASSFDAPAMFKAKAGIPADQ